ncbi:hypothetical protein ACWC9T_00010 [Kitasatospora sp. NPDC001159]
MDCGFRVSERRRRDFLAGRAVAGSSLAAVGPPRRVVARTAGGVPSWAKGCPGRASLCPAE